MFQSSFFLSLALSVFLLLPPLCQLLRHESRRCWFLKVYGSGLVTSCLIDSYLEGLCWFRLCPNQSHERTKFSFPFCRPPSLHGKCGSIHLSPRLRACPSLYVGAWPLPRTPAMGPREGETSGGQRSCRGSEVESCRSPPRPRQVLDGITHMRNQKR